MENERDMQQMNDRKVRDIIYISFKLFLNSRYEIDKKNERNAYSQTKARPCQTVR